MQPSHPAAPHVLDTLLVRVADADADAMVDLYDALHPQVLAVATALLRDGSLAEDVSQEVFTWLWFHAGEFDPRRGSAQGWIVTIARRRAVDAVRREAGWRRRSALAINHDLGSPVDEVLTRDRDRRVRASLAGLTDLQRRAITLTYFGERTFGQTAEVLDVKLSTVKTRIQDGLTRLRLRPLEDDLT